MSRIAFSVRQTENGWLLTWNSLSKAGKEYIFSSLHEMYQYLEGSLDEREADT